LPIHGLPMGDSRLGLPIADFIGDRRLDCRLSNPNRQSQFPIPNPTISQIFSLQSSIANRHDHSFNSTTVTPPPP